MSSYPEKFQEHKTIGAGPFLFSGPDGNRMCNRPSLDRKYTGESSYPQRGLISSDSAHYIKDKTVCNHSKSKASWVGEIGWGVKEHNDTSLLKNNNQIKMAEFRQELQRKKESYPYS